MQQKYHFVNGFKTKNGANLLCSVLAAEEGFEPSQNESESLVLPLHYSALLYGARDET